MNSKKNFLTRFFKKYTADLESKKIDKEEETEFNSNSEIFSKNNDKQHSISCFQSIFPNKQLPWFHKAYFLSKLAILYTFLLQFGA